MISQRYNEQMGNYLAKLAKASKPQTNADRIRGMTNEELARFIAGQRGWYCDFKDPTDDQYPIVLNWLKASVEVQE